MRRRISYHILSMSRSREWVPCRRSLMESDQSIPEKLSVMLIEVVSTNLSTCSSAILPYPPFPETRFNAVAAFVEIRPDAPGKLKYILDITIGYPNKEPLDILAILSSYLRPCSVHIHYRLFPMEEVSSISIILRLNYGMWNLTGCSRVDRTLIVNLYFDPPRFQLLRLNSKIGCLKSTPIRRPCWPVSTKMENGALPMTGMVRSGRTQSLCRSQSWSTKISSGWLFFILSSSSQPYFTSLFSGYSIRSTWCRGSESSSESEVALSLYHAIKRPHHITPQHHQPRGKTS